jgi:D-alanyl-D-alanine dipeptidase
MAGGTARARPDWAGASVDVGSILRRSMAKNRRKTGCFRPDRAKIAQSLRWIKQPTWAIARDKMSINQRKFSKTNITFVASQQFLLDFGAGVDQGFPVCAARWQSARAAMARRRIRASQQEKIQKKQGREF